MTLLASACCCDPIVQAGCRDFQLDCFNTTDPNAFPQFARVTASLSVVRRAYFFGTFNLCDCPIQQQIRETLTAEVVVPILPLNPPGGGTGSYYWDGSPGSNRAWSGTGGSFTYTSTQIDYQLCDPPSPPDCPCANTAVSCLSRVLRRSTVQKSTEGGCIGSVVCAAATISTPTGPLEIHTHYASIGCEGIETYLETLLEPFCNSCRAPGDPKQSCTYQSIGIGFGPTASAFIVACSGDAPPPSVFPNSLPPIGYTHGVGDVPIGTSNILDGCGRSILQGSASVSLSFV